MIEVIEFVDTRLFIGGPLDGQRLPAQPSPARDHVYMAVPQAPPKLYEPLENFTQPLQSYEVRYNAADYGAGRTKFRVWVLPDMTPDEIMYRLLACYRPTL